jgi:hypothetical protein
MILVGIAIGLARRVGVTAFLGAFIVAVGLALAVAARLPGISITYSVGIIATVIVVFTGTKWFPTAWSVQQVANCMLGVYLIHGLILSVISRLTGKGNYLTVVITFLTSLGFVWVARRSLPLSRFVLG